MNTTTLSSTQYNLNVAVNQVCIYVFSIATVLSVATNATNIMVLCRRSLRSSPCVHYFLALAIDSLVYVDFTPVDMISHFGFGVSITSSQFGCQIKQFFVYSSAFFFAIMLVCASIDRFFASSSDARLRSFSKVHTAQKIIIMATILLSIYMIPFFLIPYWNYNINRCSQYSSTLITAYLSSRIFLYYIVSPSAMFVFGFLTIKNIRSQTRRVGPTAVPNPHRRTEGQLARVLIIQVAAHIIFSLPIAVFYSITTFVPSMMTPTFMGLRTISVIWQQAVFFLSFFFYILSAKNFRSELQKMFKLNGHHVQITRRLLFVQTYISSRAMPDVRG